MESGRLYYCARCQTQVIICSRCDRGHRYCSAACSRRARAEATREAGQRYQSTYQGRLNHAQRQARYRQRNAASSSSDAQKVTHQGSPGLTLHDPLGMGQERRGCSMACGQCGQPLAWLRTDFHRTRRRPGLHLSPFS